MTIAFKSHLGTHKTSNQRIGAGLVRILCTVCDHISFEANDEVSVGVAAIPAWMQAAADRFANLEPELV